MTLAEFYRTVLLELRIVSSTDTAAAEDTAIVSEKYPFVHDMLLSKGLVAWTVTADLPEYAVIPMTLILAHYCAPSFGKSPDPTEGALSLPARLGGPSKAEALLREQLKKNYVSYPQDVDYF